MTRCTLCGKDHEPGKHDFSGMGEAVQSFAAGQFRPTIEADPVPAILKRSAELTQTRRNGVWQPDDPEPLDPSVNVQKAPYVSGERQTDKRVEWPDEPQPKRRGRPPKVRK